MRERLICLVRRHRWIKTYDQVHRQHGRECRRCGVAEVDLGDSDFNPNYADQNGSALGFGR